MVLEEGPPFLLAAGLCLLLLIHIGKNLPSDFEQVWDIVFDGIKKAFVVNAAIFMREEIAHAKYGIPWDRGVWRKIILPAEIPNFYECFRNELKAHTAGAENS